MYGKHHSEATKEKIRKRALQRFALMTPEQRKQICAHKWTKDKHPWIGRHHTEETKRKLRNINNGRPSANKGRRHTEEERKKMSEKVRAFYKNGGIHAMKGKHLSEETKRKISESKRKISESEKGRHISEKTREKMRQAALIIWNQRKGNESTYEQWSDKRRKKLSASQKARYLTVKHPWIGRKHTEATREKIRKSWIERRKKMK